MSPNDVNQRTDISVLKLVVKKLGEDVNEPPKVTNRVESP
jgi:hypothetical protein